VAGPTRVCSSNKVNLASGEGQGPLALRARVLVWDRSSDLSRARGKS